MGATENRWRPGPRAKVRRLPERGHYDRETIARILDEGFVCHVGFCGPDGPEILPTGYARVGDALYLHGATGNHMLRAIGEGADVCVVVTLVDALVLARSTFHHSMNYRSVVLYGRGEEVRDAQEKLAALDAVVEQIVPGRTRDARGPTDHELRSTRVVKVPIDEAAAKVRTGGPNDDDADVARGGIWAGVLPLSTVPGAPVPDGDPSTLPAVPDYVADYRRPGSADRA